MPCYLTMLVVLASLSHRLCAQAYQEMIVPFYSESIKIAYSPDMLELPAPEMKDQALAEHFQVLSSVEYRTYLKSLRRVSQVFQLNDWMYFQLMGKGLEQLYGPNREKEAELAKWFFLSQSGFDTRLGYLNDQVFVFVYTNDEAFETPMIEDRGRTFINLSSIGKGHKRQEALYLLNFTPNPGGQAFSLSIESLPTLRPVIKKQKLRFWNSGRWDEMEVSADQNVQQIMEDYPVIAEGAYMEIPLSASLANSLLPQLKARIKGKSDWEAVRIIAGFTRSAFSYKDDKDYFGSSKPMAAEEVFLYPYSDCEDRSALFYNLVKELLALPMVVIAYSNHLTIGVALPQTRPGAFYHQGKAYYICDPTGPERSSEIGVPPQGYEDAPFKVIMSSEQ